MVRVAVGVGSPVPRLAREVAEGTLASAIVTRLVVIKVGAGRLAAPSPGLLPVTTPSPVRAGVRLTATMFHACAVRPGGLPRPGEAGVVDTVVDVPIPATGRRVGTVIVPTRPGIVTHPRSAATAGSIVSRLSADGPTRVPGVVFLAGPKWQEDIRPATARASTTDYVE